MKKLSVILVTTCACVNLYAVNPDNIPSLKQQRIDKQEYEYWRHQSDQRRMEHEFQKALNQQQLSQSRIKAGKYPPRP